MILVDSSVWIDYFNGQITAETDYLHTLLGTEPVAIGDLIYTEVLQGFRQDSDYRTARSLFDSFAMFEMLGRTRALAAANNYRLLRKSGITVRKTTDTIIATFCIDRNIPLLFSDRDFLPFVQHLGLRSAIAR
ncbi:MAG: PIN domain nuclease [Wenzhouxiangellaceae bacterium]|nr:PIN domain nuclease [Wenzhouxiangellaceae bacterium]